MADLPLPPAPREPRQLRFYLTSLDDLPEPALPSGYALRTYRDGDEQEWSDLLDRAFEDRNWTPERVHKEFVERDPFRPERVFFVEKEGKIVATATAWNLGFPDWGYVHWVAADPDHRGRGLGRQVILATLHRFREEGRLAAYLDTDPPRVAAMRTYLALGFEPDRSLPFQALWRQARQNLGLDEENISGDPHS